jgi:mannose-6-phosphate isomerase
MPSGKIGESWEISCVPENESIIINGIFKNKTLTELIKEHKKEVLGQNVIQKYNGEFPLLIKFLDAQKDLSIQVHPNDELARSRHNTFGKSEMWYILEADENAELIKGFNRNTNVKEYSEKVENDKLQELLKSGAVNKDDVYYIPAGTLHNIGKGILLAEIQQSSDLTYRINDFGRKGDDGLERELHLDESMDALNFSKEEKFESRFDRIENDAISIVDSPYFKTNRLTLDKDFELNYPSDDSFRILICIEGKGELKGDFETLKMEKGDCFLIPAVLNSLQLKPSDNIELLECQIP